MLIPLLLAAPIFAAAAPMQDRPPAAPATATAPDIVVQHRSDDAIARLVETLTATRGDRQVARWNKAICPQVLGLDDVHGALIRDRIGAVAKMLGIGVDKTPCRPSLTIVVTDQADRVGKMLVDEHPGLFGDPMYGIRHGIELDELRQSRPVRWLDVSRTGGADGTGDRGLTSSFGGGSRITAPTRENTVLSLVIVDAERLTHITWGQLADYLALVTLARPRLAATPADSVMSIFAARDAGGRGPPGLTPTDLSFLQGLYRSDPSLKAASQRSQIADRVRRGAAP